MGRIESSFKWDEYFHDLTWACIRVLLRPFFISSKFFGLSLELMELMRTCVFSWQNFAKRKRVGCFYFSTYTKTWTLQTKCNAFTTRLIFVLLEWFFHQLCSALHKIYWMRWTEYKSLRSHVEWMLVKCLWHWNQRYSLSEKFPWLGHKQRASRSITKHSVQYAPL